MVAKILQRPTLVLNRNWQPVNVATVERALTMLWNESARVVDPSDFQLYDWANWSQLAPPWSLRILSCAGIVPWWPINGPTPIGELLPADRPFRRKSWN